MSLIDYFSKSSHNMVKTRKNSPKTASTENQDGEANAESSSKTSVSEPAVLEAMEKLTDISNDLSVIHKCVSPTLLPFCNFAYDDKINIYQVTNIYQAVQQTYCYTESFIFAIHGSDLHQVQQISIDLKQRRYSGTCRSK